MSQEERAIGHAGSQRENHFGFLERQRSCRCGNAPLDDNDEVSKNREEEGQTCQDDTTDVREDTFVVEIEREDETIDDRDRQRHRTDQKRNNEIGNETQTISALAYDVDVDDDEDDDEIDRFSHSKIGSFSGKNYRETMDEDREPAEFIVSRNEQKSHQQQFTELRGQTKDFPTVDKEEIEIDRSASETRDPSSPVRTHDERQSTGGSSISFTTACSSNDHPNDPRSHTDLTTDLSQNRSQNPNLRHQLPIANAFNASRTNLRTNRENNRNNPEVNVEVNDEIRRIGSNTPNVGTNVNYNPGFRNLHNELILQPLNRTNNPPGKGTFETIQVSASNTMEKRKCQCHQIQQHQHQHQQRLSHLQQLEQTHSHHHHHQHRHKLSQHQAAQQQRNQQQQQQQQQQMYRHHHYHHPHQHLGQQQEHQRTQNDPIVPRKQRSSSGQDDESDDMIETSPGTHQPPALPPRPPPRPNRRYEQSAISSYDLGPNNGEDAGCCKKYVILCCLCGGLSAAVGSLFLAVHAVLSAHTASLALFETVPSYIPGTMVKHKDYILSEVCNVELILMGLFTILLARRKHRYGFLMKMCGSVGVVCALVCVLVTVTTTVVHMSRLQGLRECIYTKAARSCTCYGSIESRVPSDPGVQFEETPHCEAVHGALYDCLRALFGVSVAGILACIFSCMLLYQLLSHEKKKMYWEQLQLRCRSLYGQGGSGAVGGPTGGSCGCCNDCAGTSPWWAQTPGNLYTPNPDLAPFRRWRLPWSRSRGPAPTPDSNYGFNAQTSRGGAIVMRNSDSSSVEHADNTPGPYSVLSDDSQTVGGASYSLLNGTNSTPYAACTPSVASYSLLDNGPLPAAWGPPPPYSDPNSPSRRPQINDDRRPLGSIRSIPPVQSVTTPINVSGNRNLNKRTIDNFESGNCEEYRQQRGTPKRPSDNYENAEEVLSSSTDPDNEMGSLHQHHHHHHHHTQHQQDEEAAKGRRMRKMLKGVENGGFQQENGNSMTKQSESELYFGDVSSCCGPESSFYDLAVDKEQQQSDPVDPVESLLEYPTSNRPSKHQRQASKRSRLPLPLPTLNNETSIGCMSDNYASLNNSTVLEQEVSRNASTRSGPYLAPDAQYEVIAQQTRYTYYNSKNGDHVHEMPISSLASLAYRNEQHDDLERSSSGVDYLNDCQIMTDHCVNEGVPTTPIATSPSPSLLSLPPSPMSHVSVTTPRCNNDPGGNPRDNTWQADHQNRTQATVEGVCPVNV